MTENTEMTKPNDYPADWKTAYKEAFLPPDTAGLPTVTAERWVLIDDDFDHPGCEGPAFDREGNFYVCRVAPLPAPEGRIVRIDPDGNIATFYMCGKSSPVGLAFHQDGRLFAVCLTGEILILSPGGELLRTIRPTIDGEGMRLNDLVFDMEGNLYFTDFRGPLTSPRGGVYRYDAAGDYETLTPILRGMSWPNGICLFDGRLLIGEGGTNAVVRIVLTPGGFLADRSNSSNIIYRNTGDGFPDSSKMDADGNLYQAIMHGGRIVILNAKGLPVGNVLAPGAGEGRNLMSSNLAIRPGTEEGYMLSAGKEDGTSVFRFRAMAKAQALFSHA
jgi:lactonase